MFHRLCSAWFILLGLILPPTALLAAATGDSTKLPTHYLDAVDSKAQNLNATLSKKTTQYLQSL